MSNANKASLENVVEGDEEELDIYKNMSGYEYMSSVIEPIEYILPMVLEILVLEILGDLHTCTSSSCEDEIKDIKDSHKHHALKHQSFSTLGKWRTTVILNKA